MEKSEALVKNECWGADAGMGSCYLLDHSSLIQYQQSMRRYYVAATKLPRLFSITLQIGNHVGDRC